jgi:hypothetical protein
MGCTPPPPLTKAEFEKRWRSGARSMEELDPEFARWLRKCRLVTFWGFASIVIAILIAVISILCLAWGK